MDNREIRLNRISKLMYDELYLQMEKKIKMDILNEDAIGKIVNKHLDNISKEKKEPEVAPQEWTCTLQAIRDYRFNEKMKRARGIF
ncbi:hypothetical protein [Clostridium felsineum]|uniref:Uncharacterized protein n=1 Tax=Clostridium felsineum TaxID=36839 RepID=A0A1S8LBX1_9CLOT|nr:hypothetical protein [Clostridium felsineum]MCR3761857.1 hypothetical protein [Clostridium felsineum]URZ04441.1 hypothetical protein CLAUR_045300 [Clostridium felsineum]URZ07350.1 hypothetical protein CLROS_026880 [Clostridium felsineum]URZ12381.1 hypothetical protein CROST_031030 [Clostridium felsineum]URZ17042.1 hypothetical protein CLFE_030940 [Clostridium felsineum DSM 794]